MRRRGIDHATPLIIRRPASRDDRALPWEDRGLTVVFRDGTAVLTEATAREEDEMPADLADALAQAAATGRDSSGRFLSVLEWLRQDGEPAESLPTPDEGLDGWTVWEPIAGSDDSGIDTRAATPGRTCSAYVCGTFT